MRRAVRRLIAATAPCLLLSLATPVSGLGQAGSAAGIGIRDSAGVRIVESREPAWAERNEWRLGLLLLDIGRVAGDVAQELYQVVSAHRRPDGTIVVAQASSQDIRMYSPAGILMRAMGGRGEGPGEFLGLAWVREYPPDSLAAYDFIQRRISVFDSTGEFGRSFTIRPTEVVPHPWMGGMFADGTFLILGRELVHGGPPDGLVRPDRALWRFDKEGAADDSLGVFPGSEQVYQRTPPPVLITQPMFARLTEFLVHDTWFYVAANDRFEIQRYRSDGTLDLIMRREHRPRTVTEADVDRAQKALVDTPDPNTQRRINRLLRDFPPPKTMPAFTARAQILVSRPMSKLDDLGNLWIREYNLSELIASDWSVFDRAGRWLGTVSMPSRFEPLDVGVDYVLGLWKDNLDVEHIRMYALVKKSH